MQNLIWPYLYSDYKSSISVKHSQMMAVPVAIWFKVKIWNLKVSMVVYVCVCGGGGGGGGWID